MESDRVIERQLLENGIELILFDRSRITAGDRWLVELKFEAHFMVDEGFWDLVSEEEPELLGDIRKILGKQLVFEITRRRNFIATNERETVLREMVRQVDNSMFDYIRKPHFPREFFKKQYRQTRQNLLIKRKMSGNSESVE